MGSVDSILNLLRAAQGADRTIDFAIQYWAHKQGIGLPMLEDAAHKVVSMYQRTLQYQPQHFTASVDAALAACEIILQARGMMHITQPTMQPWGTGWVAIFAAPHSWAPTLPLAIWINCLSVVRDLDQHEAQPGSS